jgi:hypothetical protein
MKYSNMTEGDLLSNKMEIDLNVLRPLMLHWIAGEIYGINVVTIYRVARRGGWRSSRSN